METRANYLLIGAVTLLGIVASFAFFIWYARLEIDRRFDYYDILFESVSGLSRSGDVRFNGITVGRVLEIGLDPRSSRVLVRIEVDAETPINSATTAQLQSQGVTGVSFVGLTGDKPDAPPLQPDPSTGMRVIPSTPSVIETLVEGAPELLREASDLLHELNNLVGQENRDRVSQILANVEGASAGLQTALADFSSISGTVRDGVQQITRFTGRLDGISREAETTLQTANTALASAGRAFDAAADTLGSAEGALDAARTTFEQAGTLIVERAPALVDSYEQMARSATTAVETVGARASGLIDRLDSAADLAAARLREVEAPIAAAAPTLAAVESAAGEVESLFSGDGAQMIIEARTALASLNAMLDADAPQILADVRDAAATVNRVVAQAGTDLSGFTGRLDGLAAEAERAVVDAGETFRTATATLESLAPAIVSAESALASADRAFASADRVMNVDLEPIVSDLRGAIARFDAAVGRISDDLPAITAEVRSAAESASRAAAGIEGMVARGAPGVETFATQGLPQFTRLATEARTLVSQLEQLIQRIERDPARFFLGGSAPEYRR